VPPAGSATSSRWQPAGLPGEPAFPPCATPACGVRSRTCQSAPRSTWLGWPPVQDSRGRSISRFVKSRQSCHHTPEDPANQQLSLSPTFHPLRIDPPGRSGQFSLPDLILWRSYDEPVSKTTSLDSPLLRLTDCSSSSAFGAGRYLATAGRRAER